MMSGRRGNLVKIVIVIIVIFLCIAYYGPLINHNKSSEGHLKEHTEITVPEYSGAPYIEINNNVPFFDENDFSEAVFESYSELDILGRCGPASACLGKELMPTEPRGDIGEVRPTGWEQEKYYGIVDSDPPYLYNRCHLIAYCLTAENANERNLITGTRYMNVEGMLPFEEQAVRYISKTGNHVLYRVTPIFEGNNLLASGVLMEAYSVEDRGNGVKFCVYCYNVQPGIEIDYSDGYNYIK